MCVCMCAPIINFLRGTIIQKKKGKFYQLILYLIKQNHEFNNVLVS